MPKKPMRRGAKIAVLAIFAAPAVIALFGFIVMHLWNWLVPAVFHGPTVTFWQGLGVLVLARILVGGLGPGHGDDKRGRRRLEERWEQMTPEERETFRQGLRGHSEGGAKSGPEGSGAATPA